MNFSPDSEWKLGWRIVAASALANATGISLFFYCFNLFILEMSADFGLTRSQAGAVQSLVIVAALGTPIVGWLADRLGFRLVFLGCTMTLGAIEVALARYGNGFVAMAMATAGIGFIGGGASGVVLSRPIAAHFDRYRGLALGLIGTGISVSTFFVAPWLESVIAQNGWRSGLYALAAIAAVIGMPLVLALMPGNASVRGSPAVKQQSDRAFLKSRQFWQIAAASVFVSIAMSGTIGHLSPMLQASGLTKASAALGISAFMLGQLIGKLGGGLLLDRFNPRLVAAVLNAVPSLGFVLLLSVGAQTYLLLFAMALLGLLQGANISIFAFLVARRFAISQFGAVLGSIHGIGWIGTAIGLIGFGLSFDLTGSYALAQTLSIGSLLVTAFLLGMLRLPAKD